MSDAEGNVDTVRCGYVAFNSGDMKALTAKIDPANRVAETDETNHTTTTTSVVQ